MIRQHQSVRDVDPGTLQRAAEVIRLLSHPDRLKIAELLEEDGTTVSAIQRRLNLPQAIVSQHLAKMRGCRIVEAERDGVNVRYHLVEPKVHDILNCIRKCDC